MEVLRDGGGERDGQKEIEMEMSGNGEMEVDLSL